MNFENLVIENFLSVGTAKLRLNGKGLVVIQGRNEDDSSADSNGVGKSSIADALCWAVYGETARGVSGDSVVNCRSGKNTKVEVELVDGLERFQIVRYRKHKEGKNSVRFCMIDADGETINLTKGTDKETQLEINGMIGCSKDVFMTAIYAGQNSMPDLPSLTDKQLKLLIEEAAGVAIFERAYEVARADSLAVEALIDKTERELEVKTLLVNKMLADLGSMQDLEKNFESQKAEQYAQAKASIVEAHEVYQQLKAELELVGVDLAQAELKALEQRQAENDQVKSELMLLDKKLSKIEIEANKEKSKVDQAQSELDAVNREIETLASSKEVKCSHCGAPMSAEKLNESLKTLKFKRSQMEDDLIFLTEAHAASMKNFEEVENRIRVAQSKLSLLDFTKLLQEQQNRIRKGSVLEVKVQSLGDKIKTMVATAKANKDQVFTGAPLIESTKNEIAESAKQLKSIQDELDMLKKRQMVLQDVCKVFSPSGVRAHVLESITPMLNKQTAEYLTILTDGNISAVWQTLTATAKGELREKFTIDVSNDKGAQTYAGLSGGEKRKVRLATMLALQDLVGARASKPINLYIGDEIDDALDKSGLERLMVILERKARERGTVLIISHANLSDWADQVAVVVKEHGVSRVEGALSC